MSKSAIATAGLLSAGLLSVAVLSLGLGWFGPWHVERRATRPVTEASSLASHRAARAALGRAIFFDSDLSQPRGTSCASCHEPERAFAGLNGSTIGLARGSRPGHFARRNTPSLLYLKFVRPFHYHWEEDAPLPDPRGGFFWDGRSDSLAALVEQPLTNPDEMNVRDRRQLAETLRTRPYANQLRRELGAAALDTPDGAMAAVGEAVAAFLVGDQMAPFSSRYDDFIRGRGQLTLIERRGLDLFRDPEKGNCATCHRLNVGSPKPERSLFTDYGYEALAVPRNPRPIPATATGTATTTTSYDLGLCERNDPRSHTDDERLCGSFRTPSLRNVALRPSFMHNGRFTRLRDVVAFYATRSTDPTRWYPPGERFDDLPRRYWTYVNDNRVPYDRRAGESPRLDDGEIDALVAFLTTLTDAPFRAQPRPNTEPKHGGQP
jgi:cytochrome c peroxidase